jgi:hypothetical protein
MSAPRPFALHVSDDILTDLSARLARVRWPDEIPGSGWQYGLRRWTEMAAGGHLAALEEPDALAAEIRAFFHELR